MGLGGLGGGWKWEGTVVQSKGVRGEEEKSCKQTQRRVNKPPCAEQKDLPVISLRDNSLITSPYFTFKGPQGQWQQVEHSEMCERHGAAQSGI